MAIEESEAIERGRRLPRRQQACNRSCSLGEPSEVPPIGTALPLFRVHA